MVNSLIGLDEDAGNRYIGRVYPLMGLDEDAGNRYLRDFTVGKFAYRFG